MRRRSTALAYRAAVGVAGSSVIVGGLLLVPLPGPGWPVVFLGIAVLGSEFTWAGRLLSWARARAVRARQWTAGADWLVRWCLVAALLMITVGPVLLLLSPV